MMRRVSARAAPSLFKAKAAASRFSARAAPSQFHARCEGRPTCRQHPDDLWVVTIVKRELWNETQGPNGFDGYTWCDALQPTKVQQHMLHITQTGEIGGNNAKTFALKLHNLDTWPVGTKLRIKNRGLISGKPGSGGMGVADNTGKTNEGGGGGGGGAGLNKDVDAWWDSGFDLQGNPGYNCAEALWLDGWGDWGGKHAGGLGSDAIKANPASSCSGTAGGAGQTAIVANDPVEIDNAGGIIQGGGGGGGGSKKYDYVGTTGAGDGGDPGEAGTAHTSPGIGVSWPGGVAGKAINGIANVTWIDQGTIKGGMI